MRVYAEVMEANYLQVTISAENHEQADRILEVLLGQKLVTGGQIITAPARFLWKGDITDTNYVTILSYTVRRHKDAIIRETEKVSEEEVPMITFTVFEGNAKLLAWIDQTLA
jgi:uncharacterized protein involved in tolerance to divalent cations